MPEALKDKDEPMDIDRAKAVCQVAQTLIDSAKTEVRFMEVTGETIANDFFDKQNARTQLSSGKPNGKIV